MSKPITSKEIAQATTKTYAKLFNGTKTKRQIEAHLAKVIRLYGGRCYDHKQLPN